MSKIEESVIAPLKFYDKHNKFEQYKGLRIFLATELIGVRRSLVLIAATRGQPSFEHRQWFQMIPD